MILSNLLTSISKYWPFSGLNTSLSAKQKYVPLIYLSPEIYDLPLDMSPLAPYIYRESGGGLADHGRGVIGGLYNLGIPASLLTPNYKKMFRTYSGLSEEEYIAKMHTTPEEHIFPLTSPHFSRMEQVYFSDDYRNAISAAHLQDLSIPQIKSIRRNNKGKAIVITNEQFAGGATNAYCKKSKIPNIHILHNLMELIIPVDNFHYTDFSNDEGIGDYVYYVPGSNKSLYYSHATAVKDADVIIIVGPAFGKEAIGKKQPDGHYKGRFDDWDIFKNSRALIEELKIKYDHGQVVFVPNGTAPEQLPENQSYLPQPFGPDTKDILAAKIANKLNPKDIDEFFNGKPTIDLHDSGRMNDTQKRIKTKLATIDNILKNNDDARYVYVCDDTNNGKPYDLELRQKQAIFKNKIIFEKYSEKLSNQGYASADINPFAHSYEPWGFAITQSIAAASFPVSPYNGGAVDMIKQFDNDLMKGNGFFHNNSVDDMTGQLQRAINTVRYLRNNPVIANKLYRENMVDIRERFSLEKMLNGYLQIADGLGKEYNLFDDEYTSFTST